MQDSLLVRPNYRIIKFTDDIYKIIGYKNLFPSVRLGDPEDRKHYDKKLDSSISRARRYVLEYALCNDWAYFCTFTLDKTKYDRFDLDKFHKDFTQFVRDQRKKWGIDIKFLLIPQMHEDHAWHLHGFFTCLHNAVELFDVLLEKGFFTSRPPDKLLGKGFYCWMDAHSKFGFCSLCPLRCKEAAAFYCTRYINRDLQQRSSELGCHLYYVSRRLNKPQFHGEVYQYVDTLEKLLVNDYDFCKTGFAMLSDDVDWSYAFDYMDFDFLENKDIFVPADLEEFGMYEYDQITLEGV